MRDIVDSLDYEAVVAADYGIPAGWRSDDVALGLMGVCHYGIFDVTDPAGQMIEIAALPDRKHTPERTLVVWDSRLAEHPRVSYGMTQERLLDWRIAPEPYGDLDGLRAIIERWLPPRVALGNIESERRLVTFVSQADAPSCPDCESIMVRNGGAYKCLNCGYTVGCG